LIVIDPLEDRLRRAQQLGCDVAINPTQEEVPERIFRETEGRGVDVVITACPVAEVQSQAVSLLAPYGRLCLFGSLPRGSSSVPLDSNAIHYGNLIVTGTTGGSALDYRIALRLLAGQTRGSDGGDLERLFAQRTRHRLPHRRGGSGGQGRSLGRLKVSAST
jgi:L-iditol 2-dehydrogenase